MPDPDTDPPRGPDRRARSSVGRMRRLLIDLTPLRLDPQFRLLWFGQTVNVVGNQITRIALPYQVYVLTGSPLAIAALTLAQFIPSVLTVLFGGSIADAFDRRRVLIAANLGLLVSSVGLAILAASPDPSDVAVMAIAAVAAVFTAVEQPARFSAIPRLVPVERLGSAMALNQVAFNTGSIVGPAIGGLLLATIGLTGAYLVDVLTFVVALGALAAMRPIPTLASAARPGIAAIREGFAFVRRRRLILSTFVADLDATALASPIAVFPILALDVFRVGETGLGLLAAAPAVGALVGALLSGWVGRIERIGRAVALSVGVWGLAITLFGLSMFSFPLALLCLAIAGSADLLSTVLRGTLVQLEVPDELRGRVGAIHVLAVRSGPRLGDIRVTSMVPLLGAPGSVIVGGLACMAGILAVVTAFPELPAHVRRGPTD